jgi:hypothetical protein
VNADVHEFLPLAAKIAREFGDIPGLPLAEIELTAQEALAHAARLFDPAKGDFPAYAATAMRNALRDLRDRQIRHHRHHVYNLDGTTDASATSPGPRIGQVPAGNVPIADEAAAIESRERLFLRALRERMEKHHGVVLDDAALRAAVEWSVRYLPDFRLPDKALDLVDQACAAVRFRTLTPQKRKISGGETPPERPGAGRPSHLPPVRPGARCASHLPPERPGAGRPSHDEDGGLAAGCANRIGREEIAAVVVARCGIPLGRLTADEGQRLKRMEELLTVRVKGQPEAIQAVAEAVRLARAGLKKPERPVGVFLFAGPTGTGKTELAKALAEFLFQDEKRLIRFDMSEFMEEHSVAKMIGSSPRRCWEESSRRAGNYVSKRSMAGFGFATRRHDDLKPTRQATRKTRLIRTRSRDTVGRHDL